MGQKISRERLSSEAKSDRPDANREDRGKKRTLALSVQQSPKRSSRHRSQALGISRTTMLRMMREAKLRPYRLTIHHQLTEADKQRRVKWRSYHGSGGQPRGSGQSLVFWRGSLLAMRPCQQSQRSPLGRRKAERGAAQAPPLKKDNGVGGDAEGPAACRTVLLWRRRGGAHHNHRRAVRDARSHSFPAGDPADSGVRSRAALAPVRWGDAPHGAVDSGVAQAALRRPAHQSENRSALGSSLTRPVATRLHAVGLPKEPGVCRQACHSAAAEGCHQDRDGATASGHDQPDHQAPAAGAAAAGGGEPGRSLRAHPVIKVWGSHVVWSYLSFCHWIGFPMRYVPRLCDAYIRNN